MYNRDYWKIVFSDFSDLIVLSQICVAHTLYVIHASFLCRGQLPYFRQVSGRAGDLWMTEGFELRLSVI